MVRVGGATDFSYNGALYISDYNYNMLVHGLYAATAQVEAEESTLSISGSSQSAAVGSLYYFAKCSITCITLILLAG